MGTALIIGALIALFIGLIVWARGAIAAADRREEAARVRVLLMEARSRDQRSSAARYLTTEPARRRSAEPSRVSHRASVSDDLPIVSAVALTSSSSYSDSSSCASSYDSGSSSCGDSGGGF